MLWLDWLYRLLDFLLNSSHPLGYRSRRQLQLTCGGLLAH
jgi:hypothetical protein